MLTVVKKSKARLAKRWPNTSEVLIVISGRNASPCDFLFAAQRKQGKMSDGLGNIVHQRRKSSDNILIRGTRNSKRRKVEEEERE